MSTAKNLGINVHNLRDEVVADSNSNRVARAGGVGLFLVALTFIGATWFAGSILPSASQSPYNMGPVTGDEFAAFLVENETRLRGAVTDFDKILMEARAVGDQPMIDWLRFKHDEESKTAELLETVEE